MCCVVVAFLIVRRPDRRAVRVAARGISLQLASANCKLCIRRQLSKTV